MSLNLEGFFFLDAEEDAKHTKPKTEPAGATAPAK